MLTLVINSDTGLLVIAFWVRLLWGLIIQKMQARPDLH